MVSSSLSPASFSLEVGVGSGGDSPNYLNIILKEDEHNLGRLHDGDICHLRQSYSY